MICSIYKINNLINNKIYIGQTWNTIKQRWFDHKKPSGKRCVKLHRAITRYGAENFTTELLTFCSTQESADYWEEYFIKKYSSIKKGYNIRPGGSRGKLSEEQKKAIGDFHRGKILSEETKKKISIATSGPNHHHYGKSTWNKGIPRTEKYKDEASKRSKHRRVLTDEQVQNILNDKRSIPVLAKEYKVGTSTIHRIKKRKMRYALKVS